jgi:ABC-2 type transport system ATP-binding protein
MQQQHDMTILLTTHYMEEADALCDRVALMHHGALRTIGSPEGLKAELSSEASLEDVFGTRFEGHVPAGEDEQR